MDIGRSNKYIYVIDTFQVACVVRKVGWMKCNETNWNNRSVDDGGNQVLGKIINMNPW